MVLPLFFLLLIRFLDSWFVFKDIIFLCSSSLDGINVSSECWILFADNIGCWIGEETPDLLNRGISDICLKSILFTKDLCLKFQSVIFCDCSCRIEWCQVIYDKWAVESREDNSFQVSVVRSDSQLDLGQVLFDLCLYWSYEFGPVAVKHDSEVLNSLSDFYSFKIFQPFHVSAVCHNLSFLGVDV